MTQPISDGNNVPAGGADRVKKRRGFGAPPPGAIRGNPFLMLGLMLLSALLCGCYMTFGILTLPPIWNQILMPILFSLPLMFISSVYGFPFGILCYIIVAVMTMIWHTDRMYTMSYQLIALFSTNIYMMRGMQRSLKKTLGMVLLSAVLQGLILFVNMWLVYDGDATQVPLPTALLIALEERFCAYVALYLFYRLLPGRFVRLFPVSGFYHEERVRERGRSEFYAQGRSTLGKTLGEYMAIEAILMGAATAPFVQSVFPEQFTEPLLGIMFALKVSLFMFALTVPMVVAVNFIVHGRVIAPILNMTRGMQEFAGHTGEKRAQAEAFIGSLQIGTGDELEALYHAMSDMVGEVNSYIDRIEEEKQLEEDLKVAQAANEAKTHFISHMSHEIRTPINAVIGMDEMILREAQEKNILHYARDIRNAGRTLLSIVNDILDFSRIEAGRLEIIEGEYEMSSVLNDLVSMVMPRVRDKGLDFKTHVDETLPHRLIGDEMRLKQCILNILTNAVKYTQKGKVRLSVGYAEAGEGKIALNVQVADSGVGIRREELKKLLAPFERIDEEHNRTIEGTGLGLSITANLLELMGSKIEVESEYGKGSTFHFTVLQGVADREPIGDFNEMYERLAAQEQRRHILRAPGTRILAVDDTHTNLTVIKGLLKETGIRVDTAASGQEMLEKVTENYYDLIFLDQRMPVMDGIEALHLMQLLSDQRNPEVPVIALTANVISGAREMFLREGFHDYLSKPIDPEELERMLIKHLPEGRVKLTEIEVTAEEEGAGDSALRLLAQTEGLDIDAGLKHCGDAQTLLETVRDFHYFIPSNAEALEAALAREDYGDYGTRVHALKSTARIIGAAELSTQAAQAEAWCDAGEYASVRETAGELLSLYRSYAERLAFLTESATEEEAGEEITMERLMEAYRVIRELTEAFDYDTATEVYGMLREFRIPKTERARYNEVGDCLRRLERERILELLADA